MKLDIRKLPESEHPVAALRVRTDLNSGKAIDQCKQNLEYWQDEFRQSYQQAVQNGFTPPFPMPF